MEKLTVLGREFEGTLTVKAVQKSGIDLLLTGNGEYFTVRFTGENCNFYGEGNDKEEAIEAMKQIAAASLITR